MILLSLLEQTLLAADTESATNSDLQIPLHTTLSLALSFDALVDGLDALIRTLSSRQPAHFPVKYLRATFEHHLRLKSLPNWQRCQSNTAINLQMCGEQRPDKNWG